MAFIVPQFVRPPEKHRKIISVSWAKRINNIFGTAIMNKLSMQFLGIFGLILLSLHLFPLNAYSAESPFSPGVFLIDNASMMDDFENKTVSQKIAKHNKKDSAKLYVLLLTNIPNNASVESYASQIVRDISASEKDNQKYGTVLLLVSLWDTKVIIQESNEAINLLSPSETNKIIQGTIMPKFKSSEYFSGINDGVSKIIAMMGN